MPPIILFFFSFLFWFFLGSLVPSALVLWIMRELPPTITHRQDQSRIITFISHSSAGTNHRQQHPSTTSSKAQVSQSLFSFFSVHCHCFSQYARFYSTKSFWTFLLYYVLSRFWRIFSNSLCITWALSWSFHFIIIDTVKPC